MDARLLDYYNRELRYLRELGGEFAKDFPKIAARLGLDAFECADPYVERLLEGFAFLAARVQLKIDDEFPRLAEQLLGLVCPHYVAPMPSMVIADMTPDEQQGAVADGFVVPRDTALHGPLQQADAGCEYRTAHDVVLWPVEIVAVTSQPVAGATEVPFPSTKPPKSVLRIRLRTTNGLPFSRLVLDELRFFFRGSDSLTWRAFELVAGGTLGIAAGDPATRAWTRLDGATVRPFGTEDSEALLPVGSRAFQGHRLLSEYFAFPERFLFAKVSGLQPGVKACSGTEMDLLFALDRHDPGLDSTVSPALFSLFSTPAVNLFPKRADRIPLSDSDHEYHLVADRAHPMNFEVHSVLSVAGFGAKGEVLREFTPFYRRRHADDPGASPAFFTVQRHPRRPSARQRAQGARSSYGGSEVFLALVDGNHGPFHSDLRQLAVETLCTNRDLPLLMPLGQGGTDFTLESGAPVKAVRCVAGPSAPRPPHAAGEASWRFVSQLSLNYLLLTDTSPLEGASALRELLSLYADLSEPSSRRQIEGVRSLSTRPIVRRLRTPGPLAFTRGTELTLQCDESSFEGSGAFVMGLVLSRFFARYASINSFVETVVRTAQRGEIARWPPTLGQRAAL